MEDAVQNQRSIIVFLVKENVKGSEIVKRLQDVFSDQALSPACVYEWIKRIKGGRDSLEDENRSGRPATSTSESLCESVRALLDENRRSTIGDVAEELGISHGSAHLVVHDKLGMKMALCKMGASTVGARTEAGKG